MALQELALLCCFVVPQKRSDLDWFFADCSCGCCWCMLSLLLLLLLFSVHRGYPLARQIYVGNWAGGQCSSNCIYLLPACMQRVTTTWQSSTSSSELKCPLRPTVVVFRLQMHPHLLFGVRVSRPVPSSHRVRGPPTQCHPLAVCLCHTIIRGDGLQLLCNGCCCPNLLCDIIKNCQITPLVLLLCPLHNGWHSDITDISCIHKSSNWRWQYNKKSLIKVSLADMK